MKKIFLIVLTVALFLCGCNAENTESSYSQINKTQLDLIVGQSERLTVSNADNVEWSSSDPEVVRVFYGAVTALSEGDAIISANTGDEVFECKVNVSKDKTASQTESRQETVSNSQQTPTSVTESAAPESQNESVESQMTYEERVEATENAAFELVERLTDEKYDKAIADLTEECNKIIADYKKDIADIEAELETVEKGSGKEFLLKDSIKVLNASISDTEKILNEGIASLERQREEEHKKNEEEFGQN